MFPLRAIVFPFSNNITAAPTEPLAVSAILEILSFNSLVFWAFVEI
ncbi:MAG: hypothetical protein MUC29_10070 [Pyrinomonadaceae bacterium]|nr:hypothetical protein [Pyrinomonadaceae bacterium]